MRGDSGITPRGVPHARPISLAPRSGATSALKLPLPSRQCRRDFYVALDIRASDRLGARAALRRSDTAVCTAFAVIRCSSATL